MWQPCPATPVFKPYMTTQIMHCTKQKKAGETKSYIVIKRLFLSHDVFERVLMKLLLAIVISLVFSSLFFANVNANSLKVAFVDAPPYSFQGPDNKAKGMLIDTYRDLILAIGKQPEFIFLPHRQQIEFIEKGLVDTWAGQKNSQVNDDLFLVSELPLYLMEMQVYWKKASEPVDKLQDLRGKSIILISRVC